MVPCTNAGSTCAAGEAAKLFSIGGNSLTEMGQRAHPM